MTDSILVQPLHRSHRDVRLSDDTNAGQNSTTDLQYPELIIETSFHSLLTHSIASDPVMSQHGASLSSSWTALSDRDPDNDDDRDSENTDVGSLLDAHTGEDVHIIDEYGETSDRDEQENYHDGTRSQTHAYITAGANSTHIEDDSQFLPSVQLSANSSSMLDEEQMISGSIPTVSYKKEVNIEGDVHMKLSPTKFITHDRPALVLLMTTPSVPVVIKDEILRKIGAMLVAGATDISSRSSCYHVLPTDFGPGAKLESSELIPIGTQMLVREVTFPMNQVAAEHEANPEYILKDGSRLRHDEGTQLVVQHADGSWQRPDVLLVLVSAYDACNYCNEVKTMVSEAKDYIPVFIVQSESKHPVGNAYLQIDPNSLHRAFETQPGSGSYSRTPVDARTFDYLDSEQLNRHLQFLRESLTHSSNTTTKLLDNDRYVNGTNSLTKIWQNLQDSTSDKNNQKSSRHEYFHWLQHHNLGRQFVQTTKLITWAIIASGFTIYLYYIAGPLLTKDRTLSLAPSPDLSQQLCTMSYTPILQVGPATVTTTVATKITQQLQNQKSRKQLNIAKLCSNTNDVRRLSPKETALLPDTYFDNNGTAQFDVVITRNGKIVPFMTKERSRQNLFIIELQGNDFHGLVDVAFKDLAKPTPFCAQVDLRDTILEAVAAKLASRDQNSETAEPHQFELLSYRAMKASDQTRMSLLKAQTIQPVQSIENAIEKGLVRQSRACYENRPECFIHQSQQYRDKIYILSQQVGHKARSLANDVLYRAALSLERISAAMPESDSIENILKAEKEKISDILVRAQDRAQKLVRRNQRRAMT